jgi:predicted dehydrogenase/threonine dehydrogenase-like Zn-dependent dehydrogenase
MKQVLFSGGRVVVKSVPAPRAEAGQVLVRVAWSCLSPGTELTSVAETGVARRLERLRDPARFRKALTIFQKRGLRHFSAMARERFTSDIPSGYSCAGEVLEWGPDVEGFTVGDRVACAGNRYANHAEIVVVPQNLMCRVPDNVQLPDAATVALGAIALQGVRRAQVTLGERIGVIGLGLVGQLTVQILKAAGCRVFGSDLDPVRVSQAKFLGLEMSAGDSDPIDAALRFSEGYGLDAVLLTAATKSNEPLYLAMQMTRKKGRVVVVGDVGLEVQRKAMYGKELDLLISTSYGPGRYDPTYEEEGLDYPYAYVRWTEKRNMEAYLDLVATGRINLEPLINRRLPAAQAPDAFKMLVEESPRPYTILLEYPPASVDTSHHINLTNPGPVKPGTIRLAILGAGSFAKRVHIPNLQSLRDKFRIEAVVTHHGPNAVTTAQHLGARTAATDYRDVLADPAIDAVLIATRHHLHAKMVAEALRARKHVFVEKPLALTEEELENLDNIVAELANSSSGCPVVFVGFNRRYSPYAKRLHEVIAQRSTPIQVSYRMNAGYVPPEHWVHGPQGGGRVLGEACHIFDLFRFLTGTPANQIVATAAQSAQRDILPTDNFTATIRYADGSVCTLLYTAQGGQDLPKESMELHVDGKSFLLQNYTRLETFGVRTDLRTRKEEKGHLEELNVFHEAIAGSLDRRPLWNNAVEITRTTLEVDRQVLGQSFTKHSPQAL